MTFIVTLDDTPTTQAEILARVGFFFGDTHPEFTFLECLNIELTETDKFHTEVSISFGVRPVGQVEPGTLPWALPDVWTFSAGTAQYAATEHFPNRNNNVLTGPLTNKANDAYEGIVKSEPELRAVITGYRQLFPAALAIQLTGAINNAPYAGGAEHTWQCVGISGTPERTTVGAQLIEYWNVTAELIYRKSTHNLLLPNAGLNYLENGLANKKRRCWVITEDGDRVPSANAMALADNGDLKQIGSGPYPPDILTFRVYPEENFSQYFGQPPASVSF